MKTLLLFIFLIVLSNCCFAQQFSISGRIVNHNGIPLSNVNVLLFEDGTEAPIFGISTTATGDFYFSNLETGNFIIRCTYIGFGELAENIKLTKDYNFGKLILPALTETLEEATVLLQRPRIVKGDGMLVFHVENTSLSVGNTLDLLKKTPGVLVFNDAITIKNRPTVVFINGNRTYLSATEISTFLKNLDASIISSVEVITAPSAKYEADAGTVLNIVTTKAISPGYKGSINTTYEQAIFPKYQFGTAHFYKNNWINVFGSYSFGARKENKEDDNFIRYFEPNGAVNSIWEGDFTRVTKSRSHQVNAFVDIIISPKSFLNLSSNVSITPVKRFKNYQQTKFFNPNQRLDSIQVTTSDLDRNSENYSYSGEYSLKIDEKGSKISAIANFIKYSNSQNQVLSSNYFLPNDTFLQEVSFFTDSHQNTQILTTNLDYEKAILNGNLKLGLKYSNIDTESDLVFFDTKNDNVLFVSALSDGFRYEELIYAGYFNFERIWDKFEFTLGVRGEFTNVVGTSLMLGEFTNADYFKLFPATTLSYEFDEKNNFGLSYKRSLQRPRYESLNPYRYFLNENNFSVGNPNLRPAIDNKITASYTFENKFFVEAIYQRQKDALEVLSFQDNNLKALRYESVNLENFENYSLDILYASAVTDWLYLSLLTSSYYLKNEFLAIESSEKTATNSTFGFYGQLYGGITLSKKQSLSADVTAIYYSNLIAGSFSYNNLFNFSLSLRKSIWNDRASINFGFDDIFNSANVPLTSNYLNQDNAYLAISETRLFRAGFKYNVGNFRLRDNQKKIKTDEGERL